MGIPVARLPIFLVLTFLPQVVLAASYDYLINTGNRVYELTASDEEKDINIAVSLTCKALTELVSDKEFHEDLRKMEALEEKYLGDRRRLAGDLREFLRKFSAIEADALRKAGVSSGLVDELLMAIALARGSINEYSLNREKVLSSLTQFQELACTTSKAMTDAREVRKRKITAARIFVRLGGVVVFVANVPFVVANPPVAYVSGSVGIALASGALDSFIEE